MKKILTIFFPQLKFGDHKNIWKNTNHIFPKINYGKNRVHIFTLNFGMFKKSFYIFSEFKFRKRMCQFFNELKNLWRIQQPCIQFWKKNILVVPRRLTLGWPTFIPEHVHI